MAYSAITADTVVRESNGSLTLHIASFSSVQSSTYASGLPNAVGYWTSCDSGSSVGVAAIQTNNAASVNFILTTGGLGAATNAKLYVLSRT